MSGLYCSVTGIHRVGQRGRTERHVLDVDVDQDGEALAAGKPHGPAVNDRLEVVPRRLGRLAISLVPPMLPNDETVGASGRGRITSSNGRYNLLGYVLLSPRAPPRRPLEVNQLEARIATGYNPVMKQLRSATYLLLALPAISIAADPVLVGGRAPVTLHRKATSHGHEREFTSITLLPGRGLNTFQITANLPGKGETELLRSPSLAERR